MKSRKRLYEIVEIAENDDKVSAAYDLLMMIVIIISIIPLAFKENNVAFSIIDKVAGCIFVLDYLLRLIVADYKLKKGARSFFLYPVSAMALVDLISILPSFVPLNAGFRLFKVVRLVRSFRLLRIFRVIRYSKGIALIWNALKNKKDEFVVVLGIAIFYILISALIVFNVEPDTFENYYDAIYWAVISLSTVGYGDMYCTTAIGKFFTMVSALMGIAIIALPAGIVTAGLSEEISKNKND